ncbi:inositol 1,4,5-trisphosphate receptor type 3 (macronuclear) [Tetrahymena thermophila SB210]|uniref:Inositol 1,4,5-trisphosphate receptor type 3 n=1 Tax=Tetrahymena thermophila (strain SB210) TaxID=312017 RepID=I7M298_TETTS|nr:inositol 1,4,5-trisphosphate receptor type 3 [Tetrahymena thermophila SB210]EAR99593.3 inositol 1,4,5-trisphosphate receptor type 3 [Tetrahymena thermophila SB210]|eukprot:XP_001019838.3 inositol 1,4,5-trisphosphate receptor type 3 [Tetrahymena thermophila SB210]
MDLQKSFENNQNDYKSLKGQTNYDFGAQKNFIQDKNEAQKYLRFGDYILLQSTEGATRFLSARSLYEQSVFMIQSDDHPFMEYPNLSELIFCIHPKIMYEAAQKFQKFISEGDIQNEVKLNMLQRRVEAENDVNQRRMQKYLGEIVTIGQEIQLYHIHSKAYVKATRGKNSKSSNLFFLKLSDKSSSGTHFNIKINPFLNFKKEGEKITFEDSFYFENIKFKSIITNIELPLVYGIQQNDKTLNSINEIGKIVSANQINTTELANGKKFILDIPLDVPPTLEKVQSFIQYDAGHRRDEISPFKALLHTAYVSTVQLVKQRQLVWGDYVRISHILQKDKKSGVLFSENNVSGTSQEILMETHSVDILSSPENFSSIFQILPPSSDLIGKPLNLEISSEFKYQKIRLRHALSGRYVKFNEEDQLIIGQNYDEYQIFKQKQQILLKKQQQLQQLQYQQQQQQQQNSTSNQISSKSKIGSQVLEQNQEQKKEQVTNDQKGAQKSVFDSISNIFSTNKNTKQNEIQNQNQQQSGKQNQNNNKDGKNQDQQIQIFDQMGNSSYPNYIVTLANEGIQDTIEDDKYNIKQSIFYENGNTANKQAPSDLIEQYSFIICSNSSEENILTTTCVFSIQNQFNHKKLIIDYNDDPLLLINPELVQKDGNYFINSDNFQGVFQPMNSLSRHVYKLKAQFTKKPDYFFFQKVNQKEINDIMSVHSKISQILLISDDSYLNIETQQLFQKAEDDLYGLAQWMCNNNVIDDQRKQQIKQQIKQPLKQRQNLLRELGIIDLIVKIICNIFNQQWMTSDLMKKNYYLRTFINSTIKILELACYENYPNSVYTYQWYFLFKQIILDINVYEDFRFDILINQLFQITLLNVGLKADLNQIIESVNFEDYNLKALNLMTAFCQYNTYREKQEQEQIIETLFENIENREQLFKRLIENDKGEVCLEIKKDENYLELKQKNFDNNSNIIQLQYIVGIIQLFIQLCRGGVWLIDTYINELFPQSYVIFLFESQQVSMRIRSAFLDLFRESYIMRDFQNIQEIKIPTLIHTANDICIESKSLQKLQDLRQNLTTRYFNDSSFGDASPLSPIRRSYNINLKQIVIVFLKEFQNRVQNEYKYCESGVDHQKFLISNVFTKNNHSSLLLLSVLKLTQYIIKRDFYTSLEIDQLNDQIVQILIKSLELVQLIKKYDKKIASSNNTVESENFTIENFEWINFCITLLKDICQYKQNQFLNQFYLAKPDLAYQAKRKEEIKEELDIKNAEKRTNRKKNSNGMLYLKRMQQLMIDKILLKEHSINFMTNNSTPLSEEFIMLLHLWMNLGHQELNTNIMNLVLMLNSSDKIYLQSINDSLTINNQNFSKYEMFLDLYYDLNFEITDYQRVKSNEIEREEAQIKKMSQRIQELIKEVFAINVKYEEIVAMGENLREQDINQKKNQPLSNGTTVIQDRGYNSNRDSAARGLHDVIETYKEHENSINENDQRKFRVQSTQSKQENGILNYLYQQKSSTGGEVNGVGSENGEDIVESSQASGDLKIVNCISPRDINNYFSSPELKEELKHLSIFSQSNQLNEYSQNFTSRYKFNQNGEQIQPFFGNNKENQNENQLGPNQINFRNSQKELSSKQDFDSSNPGSPLRNSKPVYYQLYQGYILDINILMNSQKMMNCIGIQNQLIEILIQISQATTIGKKDNKNQLIYDCLALLNYFILKNNNNQSFLLKSQQFLEEQNGLLKKLIQHSDVQIIELTFLLLKNIYSDNYQILLQIDKKEQHDLIQRLSKKFQENFKKKSNLFCILFIQFLPYLFLLQGKSLIQNQSFVIKQLNENQLDMNQYIFYFANKALESKIPKSDWYLDGGFNIHSTPPSNKNLVTQVKDFDPNSPQNRIFQEPQVKVIQITEDILFLISFLRTFRQIAKNSSSYVNNYIRSLFTIKQISNLIQELDDWWLLKLELLLYLTETYLSSNFIEEEETLELIHLFSVVLAEELYQFEIYLSKQKNLKYDLQFISEMQNIFNETYIGTFPNQPYIQTSFEESYYQFIVLGIFRSLRYFIFKQQDNPDDTFLGIMSQYKEIIEDLQEYINGPNLTKQFVFKRRKNERKKTHRRSSQFFIREVSPAKNNMQVYTEESSLNPQGQQQILFQEVIALLDSVIKKDYIQLVSVKRFRQSTLQKEQRNAFIRQQQVLHSKIIPETDIQIYHNLQSDKLAELVIDIRRRDTQQFQKTLMQYLNVVSNVKEVDSDTRSETLKILRNISNFKKNQTVYEKIQQDLVSIGFMKFLCDAVVSEANPQIKSLYIEGLVDFLDESNILISDSFYDYLLNDEQNDFVHTLKDFLLTNFKQYREYQKAQFDKNENKLLILEDWNEFQANNLSSIQSQIQQEEYLNAIKAKLDKCISIITLIRLCCEDHCGKFQHFFRVQITKNSKLKKNSINMITFICDIFAQFVKRIDKSNLKFGISILETLISLIEGPCIENQRELVSSKILENIEDLMLEIFEKEVDDSEYPKDVLMDFKKNIIRIALSIFEGSGDNYIINKVGQFINPSILYKQMSYYFEEYTNTIQLIGNKHKGVYLEFTKYKIPPKISQKIKLIDNSQQLKRYVFEKYGNIPQSQKNEEMIIIVYKKAHQFLSFSHQCLILLKNLRFQNQDFKQKCKEEKKKQSAQFQKQYKSLTAQCKSIEIVNQFGKLQKVFFPFPQIAGYLSSTKQRRFLEDVNRDSANEKIQGLLSMEDQFMDEMKHFLTLNSKGLYFKLSVLQNFKNTHLIIILITNFFVVSGLDENIKAIENIYGIIQLLSSSCIWLLWAIMELPLDYFSAKRTFQKNKLLSSQSTETKMSISNEKLFIFLKLIKDSHMVYLSLNILFSILGMQASKIFYSFLLIDIIDRSPVLRNVISSVTKNAKPLLLTGILGCILLTIYSNIAYYSYLSETIVYKEDENLPICHSPFACFLFMAGLGLRQDGGVGNILVDPDPYDYSNYVGRYFFDMTFYIFISVLWLNIIFGIIVDAFAELRDEKKEKDKDQESKCFICNMDRDKFENEGLSFYKHRQKEHQLWNYLFFIIHLKQKVQGQFNGTESYVYNKLENGDTTWFPIGKSLKMFKLQGENQFSQEQILQQSIEKLQEKISNVEKQINILKN